MPSEEWFEEWFNHPFYLKIYSHRNELEAKACIDTIVRETGLAREKHGPMKALDIACGAGRHAMELARRGFITTANDLSPYLIERTRQKARDANLAVSCSMADMRCLTAESKFDLVVQLFSSFGYFETKKEDGQVISNVYRSLLSGGWYILDLINPAHLEHNLIPFSTKTIDDLKVIEKRRIAHQRVIKEITISSPEKTMHFEESVMLYERASIEELLVTSGFTVAFLHGDYKGSPYDPSASPRMIIFSKKEGS